MGVAYIIADVLTATMSAMKTVSTQRNIMKEMSDMAYKAREEQRLIGEVQKGSMLIKVNRIIPEDKTKLESIDIRQNYMGPNGEWLPTQKGIRVNSEEYPQLLKVLLDTMTTDEYQDLENLGYYVDETANMGFYEDGEEEDDAE